VSARIGEPVRIGSLGLSLLPAPHATAQEIHVGKSDEITIGQITVWPALGSVFAKTRVIRSIEIEAPVLSRKGLDKLSALAGSAATPDAKPSAIRFESVSLRGAVFKLDQAVLGPLDADIRLKADGQPELLVFNSQDGRLKARVTPAGARYNIEVDASKWKTPAGVMLEFDALRLRGTATLSGAELSEISAKLYGGNVVGNASAGWGKGLQLKGNLSVDQVEIRPLLRALGRPENLSGRLNATPAFSASARTVAQLGYSLQLESPFAVHNGVLHGMDISKAATSMLSKDGGKGGETRFDRLSGHLAISQGTRRLTRLDISSGTLSATGQVTISPKDALSGRVEARLSAARLGSAAVPLNVAGTVQSPLLYPTGGTMAGAAVGTAIMGPGAGTAVGSSVGRWVEGLFGTKDPK